jgi:glycerol-3-phosphate dehydrogenase
MAAPPPAFTRTSRAENLNELRQGLFDVLILGGGINGAGLARDLKLRARRAGVALRVALVEKRHFSSGTSGRNSQLIHGGLRYLKNFEFGLVREALHERDTLMRIAPHLVEPLPVLLPMYGWIPSVYYGIGLWLYDLLAGERNVGRRRYVTRADLARMEPRLRLNGLHSAAIYYDCKVHSARLVLENLFDAARDGAVIVNYCAAGEPEVRSGEYRVKVEDTLDGGRFVVRARKVVDARGPWAAGVKLRQVRGSHLVFPRLNASENAIAHFGVDGRILFIIPWGPGNSLSLVGTTDIDHDRGADDVGIGSEEVRYLYQAVEPLFPQVRDMQPLAAYSSLRPLVLEEGASATSTSREHRIWDDESGVVRITGGKYTTYRVMSEETSELVCAAVAPGLRGQCTTAEVPLGGNRPDVLMMTSERSAEWAARYELETSEVREILRCFGVQAEALLGRLLGQAPEGLTRVECAVADWAVDHEMVQRLPDLLYVSTYWGHERAWNDEFISSLGRFAGARLGWHEARAAREVALVRRMAAFPAP